MAIKDKEVPSYWRTAAFAAFVASVAVGFFLLGNQVFSNSTAIEKSCILLDNKVVESQQQAADPDSRTGILVSTIIKQMDAETYRRFQQAPAMELARIPCEHLAEHPEEIRATPTTTTQRRHDGDRSSSRRP